MVAVAEVSRSSSPEQRDEGSPLPAVDLEFLQGIDTFIAVIATRPKKRSLYFGDAAVATGRNRTAFDTSIRVHLIAEEMGYPFRSPGAFRDFCLRIGPPNPSYQETGRKQVRALSRNGSVELSSSSVIMEEPRIGQFTDGTQTVENELEKNSFIFQEEEIPVLADAFDFLIKNREHIAVGMFVNQMGVKSEDLPRVEWIAGGINTTDLKILTERCSTMRQRLTNYVKNKNRFTGSNHEDARFLLKFFNSFFMQTELDEFLEMLFFRYLEHKSGKPPK